MDHGKQFEFDVCRLLQQMAFDAEVTGYSHDGGVDLVATSSSPLTGGRCVVQCKAWNAPVGEPVLRDLFGTMHAQGANKGVLITTSSFTAAALRFAQGKPLELIDGVRYRELCRQFDVIEYADATARVQNIPIQDSQHVRLLSVACTDPKEATDLRAHIFTSGTLTIDHGLAYWYSTADSPQPCGFSFSHIYACEVAHEMSSSGRLDLSFRTHPSEPPIYRMSFEGRTEVAESLHQAALARMHATHPRVQGSGCLLVVALPFGLAVLWKILLTT